MKYEKEIKALVEKQANDEGLLFRPQTGAEEFVLLELRKLHALIEEDEENIALFKALT